MIKITYFPHGTTTDNEKNISSGWKDVDLSNLGVKQSIELKDMIHINEFDIVFCSDLIRAVNSTKLTFEETIPIKIDKRLRECNYGDLNGASSDIVEPLQEKNTEKSFPNGESYQDVQMRMKEFIKDIKKDYDGKHIAIVAHKAPQIVFEVLLNNKTYEQAFADDWRKTKNWQPGWDYKIT